MKGGESKAKKGAFRFLRLHSMWGGGCGDLKAHKKTHKKRWHKSQTADTNSIA